MNQYDKDNIAYVVFFIWLTSMAVSITLLLKTA